MKKIFVDEFIVWVTQAKNILDDADIPCFIKNEFSTSVAGEVPFVETWPELWIHRNSDFQQAMALVQPLKDNRQSTPDEDIDLADWSCPQCDETNEGHFSLCWSCGFVLASNTDGTV